MKTYIANFGKKNYLWPECLERGTIATLHDEQVHQFWLDRDRESYIRHCMTHFKTARGISVTRAVASRWFNLMDIVVETSGDLWLHRDGESLWWTLSTDAEATSLLAPDEEPLRVGAQAYVYHKPSTGWSDVDGSGRKLLWDGLNPKAKHFLFTEGTFQSLSEDNAAYAQQLIEGEDLSAWHNRPEWKEIEKKAKKSVVKSFTAKERTIHRIVSTVNDTVRGANGQRASKANKVKHLLLSEQELKDYVAALLDEQEGLCALTGIQMQLDGESDDSQRHCSLDRIDSDGHYEMGNLQLVCRFANFWKSDQQNAEFLRLVELVKNTE